MQRRQVLALMLAASAGVLASCADPAKPSPVANPSSPTPTPTVLPAPITTSAPTPTTTSEALSVQPTPAFTKIPLPEGTLTELPDDAGDGSLLAWTVDDGADSDVLAAYAAFAQESGTRLTFFANGTYSSWTDNAAALAPLVASGQIQIGNHTWSHADLTELDDDGIIAELQQNHDFLASTFGIDPRPFYRPPYGFHDDRTDAVAASIGYTSPVLWYGSLSDSGLITTDQLLGFANQWFLPQHIVIGHANFTPVTEVYPQLLDLIAQRGLTTVTLNDVFSY